MQQDTKHNPKQSHTPKASTRRTLIKIAWATPIVASIPLPIHAMTSPTSTLPIPGSMRYTTPGGPNTLSLPTGVSQVCITLSGGGGGMGGDSVSPAAPGGGDAGGAGGGVASISRFCLDVVQSAPQNLEIYVGGRGGDGEDANAANLDFSENARVLIGGAGGLGYGNGGTGGSTNSVAAVEAGAGGGGGGASAVLLNNNPIAVAAGGGGGGSSGGRGTFAGAPNTGGQIGGAGGDSGAAGMTPVPERTPVAPGQPGASGERDGQDSVTVIINPPEFQTDQGIGGGGGGGVLGGTAGQNGLVFDHTGGESAAGGGGGTSTAPASATITEGANPEDGEVFIEWS